MNTKRQSIDARYPVTDGNGYFPLSATRARVRALSGGNGYERLPVTRQVWFQYPGFSEYRVPTGRNVFPLMRGSRGFTKNLGQAVHRRKRHIRHFAPTKEN